MPFDGSGNFSRLYSWQSDRDNGIHILASRMDGEFDNFAAGMNVVFFRNGLVPMSGNLNMGQNYIVGLGAGSVGALPFRFADDANSGIFLNGLSRPSIAANGVTRLEANTSGVLVTGTLNSSGNLSENGSRVWTAATLTPGSYMPVAGGTFTGPVGFSAAAVFNATAGMEAVQFPTFDFTRTAVGVWHIGGTGLAGNNNFSIRLNALPAAFTLDTAGNLSLTGGMAAAGAITQAGNQVWHAGNLTPGNYLTIASAAATYAPLAGAAFTGGITGTTAGFSGAITQAGNQVWHAGNLTPGNYMPLAGGTFTGAVNFNSTATLQGTQFPAIEFLRTAVGTWRVGGTGVGGSNDFAIRLNAATPFFMDTGGSVALTGGMAAAGAITQAGNQVWHAGNLVGPATLASPTFTGTPAAPTAAPGTNTTQIATTAFVAALGALKANVAGQTFTGAVNRDANFGMDIVSSNSRITFDSTDYLEFNRSTNKLTYYVGGTGVMSIDAAGNLKVLGTVTASAGTV